MIERKERDALAGGQAGVVGDFTQGIGAETPEAAVVHLDFHAGVGAGAQPRELGERQIAFGGNPGVGRRELDFYLTLKFTQAGEAGLASQQRGGDQDEREQSHAYLRLN